MVLNTAYFVYILRCSDDSLYVGITTDLERRIDEHNNSTLGAKYTRNKRPVYLEYFEKFETRSQALKREIQIKKLSHTKKLHLILETL